MILIAYMEPDKDVFDNLDLTPVTDAMIYVNSDEYNRGIKNDA